MSEREFLLSTQYSSLSTSFCSLSQRLVKHDAGGDRDVQRLYLAAQGNAHEGVAALAHQSMQPRAFAAQKERGRLTPVPVGVKEGCAGGRPNRPDVTFFQLLYQSREVGGARHMDVL